MKLQCKSHRSLKVNHVEAMVKAKSDTATFHLIEAPGFEPYRLIRIGSQPSPPHRVGRFRLRVRTLRRVRTDDVDTASGFEPYTANFNEA